ncbi:MAG: glycosyl hydrolase family protein [Moraxellaceae bacterium]|nr:MAG: glycosyl hydrolase family protein [Moraxellaceae bacterium]
MTAKADNAGIEMWGGVECTINRIGENYFSQCAKSGHDMRLSDLDLIASLKIKKLRYPILWEHLAPESSTEINWAWADERLHKLRELGIEPIVTLVHHGSGPKYATFDSEDFISGLADFAGKVAERYPWLRYFTPVNEPLTTARFAGLYGIWYPHKKDSQSFARIFINQCKAVRAAMQAIRMQIPEAQLVQTEDLGYTHSTPKLKYQANFENQRRWLTYDMLTGKVNPQHALWDDLLGFGLTEEELLSFSTDSCPPDIIGINHYVTSERYLDPRLRRYPKHAHGGNAWHRYADVEAVRVRNVKLVGAAPIP